MRLILAIVAAATVALGTAAADPTDGATGVQRALGRDLELALSAPGWHGDRWGVLVVSLESGDTLFSHGADAELAPASNLKLFTTAAALKYLGPNYRYSTYLTATGPVEAGVLRGDLLVYGTGDPTISGRFYDTKTAVWEALADSLQALGITRVEGDLVGDASYFEGPGYGSGWSMNYVTHTYAAPASALTYNDNVVTLHVTPADQVGAPPEITLVPGGDVELVNRATTVASGRSNIQVERESYDAPIVVTGQIQRGLRAGQWRAVPVVDAARYSVANLRDALAARGIEVVGEIRSVHDARASMVSGRKVFAPAFQEGPTLDVLAVHRSPPLLEILKVINQRSHNLYAESVFRTVGRVTTGHGSVEGGRAAVNALLDEVGVDRTRIHIDDGCGLSPLNRVTPGAIVQLLTYMEESPLWESYFSTLPEAAVSRGLRRMQRTEAAGNLRAKTGTIDHVSALSGYVRARNGERLAFSIISNDVPSTWTAKRVEDRIGARLARFDRPVPPPTTTRLATADSAVPAAESVAVAVAEPEDHPEESEEAAPSDLAAPSPAPSALAAATPSDSAADSAADATAEPETEPEFYTIRKGDTLDAIARRYGVRLTALQHANPDLNPRRLMPGDRIRLPGD